MATKQIIWADKGTYYKTTAANDFTGLTSEQLRKRAFNGELRWEKVNPDAPEGSKYMIKILAEDLIRLRHEYLERSRELKEASPEQTKINLPAAEQEDGEDVFAKTVKEIFDYIFSKFDEYDKVVEWAISTHLGALEGFRKIYDAADNVEKVAGTSDDVAAQ